MSGAAATRSKASSLATGRTARAKYTCDVAPLAADSSKGLSVSGVPVAELPRTSWHLTAGAGRLPTYSSPLARPSTKTVAPGAFWHDREISARRRELLKERYNAFLRSKVLAMVREMAARAARGQLDYAFMLDYDTVTNTTNLDAFAAALPGGGGGRVYTGRCVQEPLTEGLLDASRRQEVAIY